MWLLNASAGPVPRPGQLGEDVEAVLEDADPGRARSRCQRARRGSPRRPRPPRRPGSRCSRAQRELDELALVDAVEHARCGLADRSPRPPPCSGRRPTRREPQPTLAAARDRGADRPPATGSWIRDASPATRPPRRRRPAPGRRPCSASLTIAMISTTAWSIGVSRSTRLNSNNDAASGSSKFSFVSVLHGTTSHTPIATRLPAK